MVLSLHEIIQIYTNDLKLLKYSYSILVINLYLNDYYFQGLILIYHVNFFQGVNNNF